MSCGVLSQPPFGENLLLPLVVVTGIFLKTKVVCIFLIRNACELKVCNGGFSLSPVLVVCDMFFSLCWFSTVLDVKSEDCSNRLHFRLIKVLLMEAFIALNQICKSIHKLEPPFL